MSKKKISNVDTASDLVKRARKVAKQHRPDLSKKQRVRVDNKTIIYIEPGEDPDKARQDFVDKHKYDQRITRDRRGGN